MKISELARKSAISPRMLRYYEQEKLLTPARTQSGYREYQQADVERVKLIQQLNNAGFSLKIIRQILPCWHEQNSKFELCEIYLKNINLTLEKIEQQIDILLQSRTRLLDMINK